MSERRRTRSSSSSAESSTDSSFRQPDPYEVGRTTLDLDDVSDDELNGLYFDDDAQEDSFWNLPTITGLSLILVGVVYLLIELGVWAGPDLGSLVSALPVLGGVLVILLGFGLMDWRSSKSKKAKESTATASEAPAEAAASEEAPGTATATKEKRLERSRTNKKLMGVCGGIADYLNLDPTLVRIAFVIGVIGSGGPFVLAYFALGFIMPKEPKVVET